MQKKFYSLIILRKSITQLRAYAMLFMLLPLFSLSACNVPTQDSSSDIGYNLVLPVEEEAAQFETAKPVQVTTAVIPARLSTDVRALKVDRHEGLAEKIRNDIGLSPKPYISSTQSLLSRRTPVNQPNNADSSSKTLAPRAPKTLKDDELQGLQKILSTPEESSIKTGTPISEKELALAAHLSQTKRAEKPFNSPVKVETPTYLNLSHNSDKASNPTHLLDTPPTTNIASSPIIAPGAISGHKQVHDHKIALLLPLSGKYAYIGQHLQSAAEMALFGLQSSNITLLPFDTKASEEHALTAYEQAVEQEADIIVGPVFSATTWSILRHHTPSVPLISLSNDSSLQDRGIYMFGFDPTIHIRRILEFASANGVKDYMMLAPDNSYGILAGRELGNFLHDSELPPAAMEWYADAGLGLSKSLKRIARQTAHKPKGSVGLLIPEGGKALSTIVSRLKNSDERYEQFTLLGSGEWDSVSTARDRNIIGGFFATTSPQKRIAFQNSFKEINQTAPLRIASLGYDAITLAYRYLSAPDRPANLQALQQLEGLNGRYYFKPNGQTERFLSVLQVTKRGFSVIDE